MTVLLDTHALLWFLTDDRRLSRRAHAIITDPERDVRVSIASLWEIAIKSGLGKLALAAPYADLFPDLLEAQRIDVLGVSIRHLVELERLPLHHRDPFDRLLIAQALAEGVPIVSRDAAFARYPVEVLWNDPA